MRQWLRRAPLPHAFLELPAFFRVGVELRVVGVCRARCRPDADQMFMAWCGATVVRCWGTTIWC